MTDRPLRTWRVVLRTWDEYVVKVEARSSEEAEEIAVDEYDGLDHFDGGIERVEASPVE